MFEIFNQERKSLGIVIPYYNDANVIEKTLKSIEYLTKCKDLEIEAVVIDDCSTKEDSLFLRKMGNENYGFKLKVIHLNANGGPGIARNIGLNTLKTDYLTFLDSGDVFTKDFVSVVDKIDDQDIIIFDYIEKKGRTVKKKRTVAIDTKKDIIKDDFIVHITNSPWCKIYKTSFIKKYKICFGETYTREDLLFTKTAAAFSETIDYFRIYGYEYIRDDQSLSMTFKMENNDSLRLFKQLSKNIQKSVSQEVIEAIALKSFYYSSVKKEILSKGKYEIEEEYFQKLFNNEKTNLLNNQFLNDFPKHIKLALFFDLCDKRILCILKSCWKAVRVKVGKLFG